MQPRLHTEAAEKKESGHKNGCGAFSKMTKDERGATSRVTLCRGIAEIYVI
jgi:hypothetical protein